MTVRLHFWSVLLSTISACELRMRVCLHYYYFACCTHGTLCRFFGYDTWLLLCGQHFANRLHTKMKGLGEKVATAIVVLHYKMAFTSPTPHGMTAIVGYARSLLTLAKCPEDLIVTAEELIKGETLASCDYMTLVHFTL
jgi:hypothetical protein